MTTRHVERNKGFTIERLEIENFRGFEKHSVEFHPLTVAVGVNNAGKSSLVECLRLISLCVSHAHAVAGYRRPPDSLSRFTRHSGVKPSTAYTGIDFEGICHCYRDPPARAKAYFSSGAMLELFAHPQGDVFAFFRKRNGQIAGSRATMLKAGIPTIHALPQVAPLRREETILEPGTVRRALATALAPQHFRNQLNLLQQYYEDFKVLLEQTWRGVIVDAFIGQGKLHGTHLSLLIRDHQFVAEAARLGHGFQIWLQMIWFLARSSESDVIILDEPDVYLHTDLQKKLLRLLQDRHPQTILTSHSADLLMEVPHEDILIVDKLRSKSSFATDVPMVQHLADSLGAQYNIQLARLWASGRFIMVEGDDLTYLSILHQKLYPHSASPLTNIPNLAIGGWGGWQRAGWSSQLLLESIGKGTTCYCILDRDYHSDAEVEKRYSESMERGVKLHVWRRKEIENYLLVPSAIQRVIHRRMKRGNPPKTDEVAERIAWIAKEMWWDILNGFSTSLKTGRASWDPTALNNEARQIIDDRVNAGDPLWHLAGGKSVVGQLSKWAKDQYGVSFSGIAIAREMQATEIPDEIISVLTSLEYTEDFTDTAPLDLQ